MFKFGFSGDKSEGSENKKEQLHWFDSKEIQISRAQISEQLSGDETTNADFCGINLKLISSDNVAVDVINEGHENIIKAEKQHSDLLPAIYEGGLKVWECTHDLLRYVMNEESNLEGKRILDLGCGAGILGICCLLKGAVVDFQDYNSEVIQLVTIPNVLLNSTNRQTTKEKTRFYSGDWTSFTELFLKNNSMDQKYDLIMSSETIYNPENHEKLYQVFKQCLKDDGIGYIAGKTYYFGVGGGMRQFENLVSKDNVLHTSNVWKSEEGLQREIIKLTRLK